MILRFIFTCLFIALTAFPVMAEDVSAEQSKDAIKIVVVDIQQLMSNSKAAKSIQSQGKDLRDKYQKQITKIEAGLKETEAELMKLSKGDSKEDFLEKRKEFQQELVKGQKEVQEINQKLDKALGQALNELRDEIVEIVGNMSQDNGYDLVISRADVVIVAKSIDITADVMKKLDKSLSKISVKG